MTAEQFLNKKLEEEGPLGEFGSFLTWGWGMVRLACRFADAYREAATAAQGEDGKQ